MMKIASKMAKFSCGAPPRTPPGRCPGPRRSPPRLPGAAPQTPRKNHSRDVLGDPDRARSRQRLGKYILTPKRLSLLLPLMFVEHVEVILLL